MTAAGSLKKKLIYHDKRGVVFLPYYLTKTDLFFLMSDHWRLLADWRHNNYWLPDAIRSVGRIL